MAKRFQIWQASFCDIFSFENEEAKGRVISLASTLLTTTYNVFITGIFYTGFLSVYGLSITDVGILTFIPYLANSLGIFSPKLLGRFQRRKKLLLGAKLFYYTLLIVFSNLFPLIVTDHQARLAGFILITTFASSFFALFGPGITTWFYNFYPGDMEKRTRFLALTQIVSSILSSALLLGTSFLTDMLNSSPYQKQLILGFRYFAFALVLLDVFFQSRAKEYPYAETSQTKLSDVFTLPFKYKKFLACMLLMFFWNFSANLNNGLWTYHLLNHMHFSYVLINTVSVLYTVCLVLLSFAWQIILRRYSWVKTFGIALLLLSPTELMFFYMTPDISFIYLPVGILQSIFTVGLNLSYANILYMNLPMENSTTHIAFNTIGCNIFAFLGLATGTFISSITNDDTFSMLGMELYSVQFTCLMKALLYLAGGLFIALKWRSFTPADAIAELEHAKIHYRRRR